MKSFKWFSMIIGLCLGVGLMMALSSGCATTQAKSDEAAVKSTATEPCQMESAPASADDESTSMEDDEEEMIDEGQDEDVE